MCKLMVSEKKNEVVGKAGLDSVLATNGDGHGGLFEFRYSSQ